MKTSISRLQIILIIAVCLSAIIMIVSIIFDHSLHIFRYAGYFTQNSPWNTLFIYEL